MIINSNEVHSIDSPEENHTAVLQIPLKQFEDYFTAHRFVRFAGSVPEMDATLWRLVREMYKLYGKRGVGYEFKIRSFYYDVLYFLVNHYRLDEAAEQEVTPQPPPGCSCENYFLYERALSGRTQTDRSSEHVRLLRCIFIQNVPEICKCQF